MILEGLALCLPRAEGRALDCYGPCALLHSASVSAAPVSLVRAEMFMSAWCWPSYFVSMTNSN